MDAGMLNRRVTIERLTTVPNGQGGQVRSWRAAGMASVKATPIAGKEALVAGGLRASQPWRIEMRYRADISTADRLTASWLPSGWAMAIQSLADPDGKRRSLVLFCTAGLDLE